MAAVQYLITMFLLSNAVFRQVTTNTDYTGHLPTQKQQLRNLEEVRLRANSFFKTLPAGLKEDAKLDVPQIIKKYGYPVENHVITTSDGYILTIHRIPYGRSRRAKNRPPVLLQHGLMSSSADWIIPGPSKALGYILADKGYDVWMGNARGTRYSRNHTSLDPISSKFWQFSWHEIALLDMPAVIDHILAVTRKDKLYYIGHSQGTTVFYVVCSEKPEYNKKIRMQISLAPVAYMSHLTCPLFRMLALYDLPLEVLTDIFKVQEFVPDQGFLLALNSNYLCNEHSPTEILCTNGLFSIFGFNEKQINRSLVPMLLSHAPSGSSTKQFLHYAQEINSGKFRRWDYGLSGNFKHYGLPTPPEYNISNIKTPMYFFWSKNDWLAHEIDILRLCRELKKFCAGNFLVSDKKFSHLDYLYAIDVRELLYNQIVNLLAKH